ncbi:DUF3617 family protein [Duganella sp. Root336D2]|uniref:DUF3617 domain-containing protein n=1 Tax=Duganella sp. Root336D2 TaxID=1736518 RepID=UPI0006F884E0|nr:DUF3617 family protein [Duganella sp. Root336D2]KQV61416.1 hypothetical protein ASD07_00680 [Duganella sp. Root336D2]
MKLTIRALALTAGLATVCLTSHAEVIPLKLAPGLWEETRVTLINGQNVEEAMRKGREKMMARLTPEQRKQMQEQMGRGSNAGGTQTCLTPAQVAKGVDTEVIKRKMEQSSQGCKLDIISASSSGAKFKAACMGPQGNNYNGSGEYIVANSKEWRFKMVGDGKVTGPNGAPVPQAGDFHATQEVTARWKGSDCGNVPPQQEG